MVRGIQNKVINCLRQIIDGYWLSGSIHVVFYLCGLWKHVYKQLLPDASFRIFPHVTFERFPNEKYSAHKILLCHISTHVTSM